MRALHINGNELTFDDLRDVVYERRPVLLEAEARRAVERAREIVEAHVADERPSYGVTTGVGKLADVRIAPEQIRELQVNLVRSDRKSTRLNSSHRCISYAVFCLKK